VKHSTLIAKVSKIIKESILIVSLVFSTEKCVEKEAQNECVPKVINFISDKSTINAKPQLEILLMT
jgi:hypothetical protein